MSSRHIWIMDGHNMIFAIRPLQRLQVSDRREEARSALTDRLERFALSRSERVLVVFDGDESGSNPESRRPSLLEVVYTRRGIMVADDRILQEARRSLDLGLTVTVVTDDVSTLARDLPRRVQHLRVREFWLKYVETPEGAGSGRPAHEPMGQPAVGKRVEGDFSDVEREMLARSVSMETRIELPGPLLPLARKGSGAQASAGSKAAALPTAEESVRERLRRKREKGRLRQERRLKRRSKPVR